MRIKFLSVIVSLLFVSFAISSCLNDNNQVGEYSTDATIHAFALDTVRGKSYQFTIDQLKGEIYNLDSLPMGSDTIIDKILIKTLTTVSGAVILINKEGKDSIKDNVTQGLNTTDSVDFREPLKVKVMSMEAMNLMYQGISEDTYKKYTRRYTIEVRVHKQDPDSLNWGQAKGQQPAPLMKGFSGGAISGPQKAVILNKTIFVFSKTTASQVIAYKTLTDNPRGWTSTGTINGLPASVDLSSILNFKDQLYAVAQGIMYYSTDGTNWQKHTTLNDRKIASLLVGFPENQGNNLNKTIGIAAVSVDATDAKIHRFCFTNENATSWTETSDLGEVVADSFPRTNISATIFSNNTGVQGAMLMGTTTNARTEAVKPILPWSSYNGLSWADLYTQNAFCPILTLPSIIHYGKDFYAFGNEFDTFYTSVAGIAWYKANKKFYFPAELTARKGSEYSMVVDSNNFIWIICSKGLTGTDDVWRCRLNKLGFKEALTQ